MHFRFSKLDAKLSIQDGNKNEATKKFVSNIINAVDVNCKNILVMNWKKPQKN